MIDVADLESAWWSLLQKVHSGKHVRKQEVIDLLRSGEPVPPEAAAWLAKVLEGSFKFKRGGVPDSRFGGETPRAQLDYLQSRLSDTNDNFEEFDKEIRESLLKYAKPHRHNGTSTRETAKAIMAESYGVSVRKLEGMLRRRNKS